MKPPSRPLPPRKPVAAPPKKAALIEDVPEEKPKGPFQHGISFAEAFKAWLKISLLSFGGPAGQIAVMHRVLVEEKRFIGEKRFLHALNYCILLPGPEAQQLLTYTAWMLHGAKGGLTAGIMFVLPGFLSILVLAIIYVLYNKVPLIEGIFMGLKPAVLAVVFHAVGRIGAKALKSYAMMLLASLSFIGIFFLSVPFPVLVLGAGLIGYLGHRFAPSQFVASHGHKGHKEEGEQKPPALPDDAIDHEFKPGWGRNLKVLFLGIFFWFTPLLLAGWWLGLNHVLWQQGVFFSKLAVVTFGGAYAVLGYVAQEAVNTYQWVTPPEMLDGLGLAETTPGPLIMVLEFVGFLGAYRNPGNLSPMTAGVLAAFLSTWVTFAPCFLWIFLGAPYVERLRHNQHLGAALNAITAAVVGVVLNLAIWFALHVIFTKVGKIDLGILSFPLPLLSSIDWMSLGITIVAMLALFWLKAGMGLTLLICAVWGAVFRLM